MHRAWRNWAILAVVTGIGLSLSRGDTVLAFGILDWTEDFGWSPSLVSLAWALGSLVAMVMCPVSGMMGDRLGARRIMFWSGVLFLVGVLLLAVMSNALFLFIVFGLILGIVRAFLLVPLHASVSEWFMRRFSLAVGLLGAAEGIFRVLLPTLGALLLVAVGWRIAFLFIAIAVGGLIMLGSLFFRSRPSDVGLKPYGDDSDASAEAPLSKEETKLRLREYGRAMRRTRAFKMLPVINGLGSAGYVNVMSFIAPHMYNLGLSAIQAGSVTIFIVLFSAAGSFAAPVLAERMGGKPVLLAALLLQGITASLLFFTDSLLTIYLLIALFGLGGGSAGNLFLVLNRQYLGYGPIATPYGYQVAGGMLGVAAGTGLGGPMLASTGYGAVFLMSAVFSVLGALTVFALESTRQTLIPSWRDMQPQTASADCS